MGTCMREHDLFFRKYFPENLGFFKNNCYYYYYYYITHEEIYELTNNFKF